VVHRNSFLCKTPLHRLSLLSNSQVTFVLHVNEATKYYRHFLFLPNILHLLAHPRCLLGIGLDMWAWENPTIWENTRGLSVYAFNEAWGKKEDEKLIHNDIILHLRKALDNLIKKEKK
jgi:hypothetical protein